MSLTIGTGAHERESVKVLRECIDLQIKKSNDYQNPNSSVVQAMHYRRGVDTIHDMLHQKMLRALSLLEAAKSQTQQAPNFESLEDTYKDIINYASFAVSYIRGEMEGQDKSRNMFNEKPVPPIVQFDNTNWGTHPYIPVSGEVKGVASPAVLPFTGIMGHGTTSVDQGEYPEYFTHKVYDSIESTVD